MQILKKATLPARSKIFQIVTLRLHYFQYPHEINHKSMETSVRHAYTGNQFYKGMGVL